MKNINDSDIQMCIDTPEILYKYRSLSGDNFGFTRDIFLKNELYFPHPDEINDPFDCKIPPSFKKISKKLLIDKITEIESKPDKFKFDPFVIELAKNGVISNNLETITETLQSKYNEKHLQNVGILSLSEEKFDIRMWSHYSNSHKGICIGFNWIKLYVIFNGTHLHADNVKYPKFNQYPVWNPFIDDPQEEINKLYFTKSLDWSYEKEWRIVFPEKGGTAQNFNPNAIVSVHLGCHINKEHKENVINWCLQRKQKPKIYEITKDEESYSLQEKEVKY